MDGWADGWTDGWMGARAQHDGISRDPISPPLSLSLFLSCAHPADRQPMPNLISAWLQSNKPERVIRIRVTESTPACSLVCPSVRPVTGLIYRVGTGGLSYLSNRVEIEISFSSRLRAAVTNRYPGIISLARIKFPRMNKNLFRQSLFFSFSTKKTKIILS